MSGSQRACVLLAFSFFLPLFFFIIMAGHRQSSGMRSIRNHPNFDPVKEAQYEQWAVEKVGTTRSEHTRHLVEKQPSTGYPDLNLDGATRSTTHLQNRPDLTIGNPSALSASMPYFQWKHNTDGLLAEEFEKYCLQKTQKTAQKPPPQKSRPKIWKRERKKNKRKTEKMSWYQ